MSLPNGGGAVSDTTTVVESVVKVCCGSDEGGTTPSFLTYTSSNMFRVTLYLECSFCEVHNP